MMVLYSGTTCPFSHRCRFVLFEKGMDFEIRDVDLYNKPEDISVMNPYGQVPILVERDLILYESNIINEYIDERFPHPQLMPGDPVDRARVRGADWLYTYLRTFYRDPKTTTGWNNVVYPNVAMPHALWTLQGERAFDAKDHKWSELSKGSQSATEYDATVRDLVNFLVYVGEPAAGSRKSIGIIVLFVLGLLFIFAYLLKKEFWKDVT